MTRLIKTLRKTQKFNSNLRAVFIAFCCCFSMSSTGQSIKDQVQRDTMSYIYELDQAQLEYIYKKQKLKDTTWFFTHKIDSCQYNQFDFNKLDNGCYLKTQVSRHSLSVQLVTKAPFTIETKTIKKNHLLYLKNPKNKEQINDATLTIKDAACKYDAGFGGYKLIIPKKKKKKKTARNLVRIQYQGKNYYYYLNEKNNYVRDDYNSNGLSSGPQVSPGYFIVSQPKYRPLDTVKFKAFLVNHFNGKPIRKKIWLSLKDDRKTYWSKKIKRKTKGAYFGEFALPDSLKIDKEYRLKVNYYKRGHNFYSQKTFRLEDYQLDKNNYKLILPKDTFYAGEPAILYAKATDANGFNLSDTRMQVRMSVERIIRTYEDTIIFRGDEKENWYALDTMMNELEPSRILIPKNRLLNGLVQYKIVVDIKDERQEKKSFTRYFYWEAKKESTTFSQYADTIIARHTYLLKDTAREYDLLIYQNTTLLDSARITTPFKKQIAFNYTHAVLQKPNTIQRYPLTIRQNFLNLLKLSTARTYDSVKIKMSYPLQQAIHYKIYRNDKEVASGASREINYKVTDKTDALYYLLITTNLNGQLTNNYHYFKIGQDKNELTITTNFPKEIYPGHEQAIEINVKDYQGTAVKNVNLTAYAVSSMFKNEIRKPYINIPKKRTAQLKKMELPQEKLAYQTGDLQLNQTFRLQGWMVREFNLYKNDYYKIYHSQQDVYTHYISLKRNKKTVDKSIPISKTNKDKKTQDISFCEIAVLPLLENEITRPSYVKLDGELIYHNNINARLPYAASVKPGKHTVEFRFQDKLFRLENIRTTVGHKALICVRLDSILERKSSPYIIKDSLPSYAMTKAEFNTLDNNSIFAYGLYFDTLKVYPLNDEANAIYYFSKGELGSIQVRDENFRVIGLPPNSHQKQFVLDMGKDKKTVTNKTREVLFFYDNKIEYKKYDSTAAPLFGAGRRRVQYAQLLDRVNNILPPEKEIAEKKIATPSYKQHVSQVYQEKYVSPVGTYTPTHKINGYIHFDITSHDTSQLVGFWLIHKNNPNLSTFYRYGHRNRHTISYYGQPDAYDLYFLFSNKTYTLLSNQMLSEKEQWVINANLLAKQAVLESSFTEPIILYNQLTKVPMEPFVSYPDESALQVKISSTQKRSAAMLNGILRNAYGSILSNTDIFLEKNGYFYSGATTNKKGEFEFLNIPKGNYMLKVFTHAYRPRYAYNVSITKNAVYSYTIELKDKNTFVPDLMVNQNELQLRVFQAKENANLKSFGNVFDMDSRAPMSNVNIEVKRIGGKKLAGYKSSITGRYTVYTESFSDSAYHITFSKAGYRTLVLKNVELNKSNINQMQVFLRIKNSTSSLPIIIDLEQNEKTIVWDPGTPIYKEPKNVISTKPTYSKSDAGGIDGKIIDQKGQSIPFASIGAFEGGVIKAQSKTDFNGNYKLKPLGPGTYTLKVRSIGKKAMEIRVVRVREKRVTTQNITMQSKTSKLKAVMIVSKKMVDATNPGDQSISGREIASYGYASSGIRSLKGLRTISGVDNGGSVNIGGGRGDETLYIIDGIPVRTDEEIRNLPTEIAQSINEFKSGVPAKIGNANGGVIVIKKKGFNLFKAAQAKSLRTRFSNLGFWVPNLVTNKQGNASVTVTFPDDVTRWRTYIVGMGKDFLNGVHTSSIKSYKPIMVNSIVPRFLYQTDKLEAKAKYVNFDTAKHNVQIKINIDNQEKISKSINLDRSFVDSVILTAGNSDTLVWRAELDLDTFYKDGEEISIPILKDGLESVDYFLEKLDKDSSQVFDLKDNEKTTIYFNNTILENILVEVNKLKNYPYACNEQKASKVKGLLVEEKIRKQLKQTFENRSMLKNLINRLERAQRPNGSWSWWSNGGGNNRITLYITEVLQEANANGYNNSASLLAKEYIRKNVKYFSTADKVYALYLLKKMNVDVDYDKLMDGISYYDLNLCSKLYYLNNSHRYKNKLSKAKVYDCLSQLSASSGSSYSNNFFYDPSANMALAIKLLKNTGHSRHVSESLSPFIASGKFIAGSNTFSKIYLIEAWLETMAKENKSLATELIINDTLRVNKFPYVYTTTQSNVKIRHTGAPVYTSFVQDVYKPNPPKIDSLFDVKTAFITDKDSLITKLKKGEDINLDIRIMSFRTAKNIMIEIPIPSACTYNGKSIARGNISHIEYYKNKAIFYIENVNVGETKIRIPLRVNFSGDYSLPPTRASLMYYPFKTGNNVKRRVLVD